MNKTLNINLGGTFFHIDEDAFGKLSRYLEAIKRSFKDPNGQDEIIKDIEYRIAELFSEKLKSPTQVVTLKELDEVIAVMGQPEDYIIDEEIFEETDSNASKKQHSYKQLFRDVDNKFIAGVSSGLAHYLNIDAFWIRLAWILLTIFSSGIFIFVYIIFWILVPPALTTSDKLKMTREPINISNIEKKIKEGASRIEKEVKNIDKNEILKKSSGFFDAIAKIFKVLLLILGKFIGILFIFIAVTLLITLTIGLFTGSFGIGNGNFLTIDYLNAVNATGTPVWVLAALLLTAIGIPLLGMFILGLKLVFTNLKSIGATAKILLFIVWISALITLGIFAVKQASTMAYNGKVVVEEVLPIKPKDTLFLKMNSNNFYEHTLHRDNSFKIILDENDNKIIYSNNIRLIVRATNDSIAKLYIEKKAGGNSFKDAKQRANSINYAYEFSNNSLDLNGFFTTNLAEKYNNQNIQIILYLPKGSILKASENTYSFHRNSSSYNDILNNGDEEHFLLIQDQETKCLDCPNSNTLETKNNTFTNSGEDAAWKNEVKKALNKSIKKDSLTNNFTN